MNVLRKALVSSASKAGHWSLVSQEVTWGDRALVASSYKSCGEELWQGAVTRSCRWLARWLCLFRCIDSTVDCLLLKLPLEASIYQ